ncbi:sulfurtransferase [Rhodococcus sp. NPDC003318]|uniref:sulfurtransferase n=1 Tax=Rhodococcus sp. NPDC003318 TaxID=3364503 RepID=UPI0036746206
MTLLTTRELIDLLAADRPVRVLDIRWSLAEPDGSAAFAAGHIPGAVYVDLETELGDHSVSGRGRHPLPSGADLQASLRRAGVNDGDTVVTYDDWNRAGSSRAWWVLRAAGLTDVHILDGGLGAWTAAGEQLESGTVEAEPGSVALPHPDLYAGSLPTLTAEEAAKVPGTGVLLDARAPERFRGEVEPVDSVAGHIPGAQNLPSTSLLAADGTFRPVAELQQTFATLGVDGNRPAGAYCGSGVTAAVVLAAADAAGVDLALFPGSWSQWSSNPDHPVEVGDGRN